MNTKLAIILSLCLASLAMGQEDTVQAPDDGLTAPWVDPRCCYVPELSPTYKAYQDSLAKAALSIKATRAKAIKGQTIRINGRFDLLGRKSITPKGQDTEYSPSLSALGDTAQSSSTRSITQT